MPVRGLTVVLSEPVPARARTALNLACATAALGARARLFLDAEAVPVLRRDDDPRYPAAGLPTLAQLVEEALGLGVAIILCQTGLQLSGASMADHDPRLHAGGLVSLLETLGEDRLTTL